MQVTAINMDLTTACDRKCPNCCCAINMGKRPPVHHPWSYFEAVAPYVYGIDNIKLTGGEPTVHPRFAEFVPKFRDLFGCKVLTLVTDGFGVERYREIIDKQFDEVHFSDYHTKPAAREVLHQIGVELHVFDAGADSVNFIPRSRRGSGRACDRAMTASGLVAYADGKFWPCCVSPGLDGTTGIEPCHDWREKLIAVDMGCRNCFFSPTIEELNESR